MTVLKPMSFEEELNAPANVKRTRNNKLKMGGELDFMSCYIEQMRNRLSKIPEKDDERHAEMVERLAHLTKEAFHAVERATFYNGEDVM